jgi:hypothetical protein
MANASNIIMGLLAERGHSLTAQTATLTLRILNTRNPLSSGYHFNFDYFDAWDGTPMPRGQSLP